VEAAPTARSVIHPRSPSHEWTKLGEKARLPLGDALWLGRGRQGLAAELAEEQRKQKTMVAAVIGSRSRVVR
jgi:hypothetical protein